MPLLVCVSPYALCLKGLMADTLENEELHEELPSEEGGKPSVSKASISLAAQERDQKDKEDTFLYIANFLKKHAAANVSQRRMDVLDERYVIQPHDTLPQFSNDFAVACAATDESIPERKIYALILRKEIPFRMANIVAQASVSHPSLLQLIAHGQVQLSDEGQYSYVIVMERPEGRSLREVLESRKTPFSDHFIISDVITPIVQVLKEFAAKGISHGNLNVDTVFFSGDKVQVGESVSQPSGYSQHYHFETTERTQSIPIGKGEGNIRVDVYALGVIVAHMLLGIRYFERLDSQTYLQRRMMLGTYNTLLGEHENANFSDFFKGALHDNPEDRWSHEHIEQWVGGKKFNLLSPSLLREAQRPFPFIGEEFFNRRALADAFAVNWDQAEESLRSGYISRWVEVSLHRNEMATALRKVTERTGGINSGSEKVNNELVARSIAILDPEGPIRLRKIACFADGLGPILANGFRMREQSLIQGVVQILDYNAFTQIREGATDMASKRLLMVQKKFTNCSKYLRMQGMGFGMERVLYELNPDLPCQSPLFARDTVLTLTDLLEAVDRLGARQQKGFDYLDRHIAAFVAAKMDISREVTLGDSRIITALSQNPQLIILHMLSLAQNRMGKPKMKGVTAWATLRILPLVDNFHGSTVRHRIRVSLKSAALSGDLANILAALTNKTQVNEDQDGYQRAIHAFSKNQQKIERLVNREKMLRESNRIGMLLAMIVSYSMLGISLMSLLARQILR